VTRPVEPCKTGAEEIITKEHRKKKFEINKKGIVRPQRRKRGLGGGKGEERKTGSRRYRF